MARPRIRAERRPAIVVRHEPETPVIKSAARVLQILEFFDDIRRPANSVEVSETLGYPQSSTSALLRSMAALGYLDYDRLARTYTPSSRVALLGNWVNEPLFRDGKVLRLMEEISRGTGDTVILAMRNGLHAQYIHVIQPTQPGRYHMTLGTVRSLAASGTGYALLSGYPDVEVTRIVLRINAEAPSSRKIVSIRDLLAELAEVRRRGYALTHGLVNPDIAVLAMPLPNIPGQKPLVVGIGTRQETMAQRREEIVALMRGAIARNFPEGMTQK
jgi:DNA-binding IclR family transcriptional regulator